jgi:predicted dehydrogenase
MIRYKIIGMPRMRFLVVGCGSIGERHIRNLMALQAVEIAACDSRRDRLIKVRQEYGVEETYTDLKQALSKNVNAVLVCTPTALHVPVASAVVNNCCHVFIEKPLSHNLDGVDELIERANERNLVVMIGFNLRFHPNLQRIKKLLNEERIGKIICARVQIGQYLPDWHPREDYRKSYSAQRALGGGVILDAVHELDYIRWFLGDVKEVFCYADKLSALEIDTEDIAEIILRFETRAIAEIHMDYVQRSYSRSCQLIGDEGTIIWNFNENRVKLYSAEDKRWQTFPEVNFDHNETYVQEMKHFIQCVIGDEKPPVNGLEGKRVLEIALAAKRSAETGLVIKL